MDEQKFRAHKGHRVIAFGAADGTTHRLRPDADDVITVTEPEDAAYIRDIVGLKHIATPRPADPAQLPAAKAEKEA